MCKSWASVLTAAMLKLTRKTFLDIIRLIKIVKKIFKYCGGVPYPLEIYGDHSFIGDRASTYSQW